MEKARRDLMMRSATLYFQVLRETRKLETVKMEIKSDLTQQKQVKGQFIVGISSLLDVNQIEAAYEQDRVKLIRQQGALREDYARLEALTGQTVQSLWPLKDQINLETIGQRSLTDWTDSISRHNPKVLAAVATQRAAEKRVSSAKAARWPTLTLQASYQKDLSGRPLVPGANGLGSIHTDTASADGLPGRGTKYC